MLIVSRDLGACRLHGTCSYICPYGLDGEMPSSGSVQRCLQTDEQSDDANVPTNHGFWNPTLSSRATQAESCTTKPFQSGSSNLRPGSERAWLFPSPASPSSVRHEPSRSFPRRDSAEPYLCPQHQPTMANSRQPRSHHPTVRTDVSASTTTTATTAPIITRAHFYHTHL